MEHFADQATTALTDALLNGRVYYFPPDIQRVWFEFSDPFGNSYRLCVTFRWATQISELTKLLDASAPTEKDTPRELAFSQKQKLLWEIMNKKLP